MKDCTYKVELLNVYVFYIVFNVYGITCVIKYYTQMYNRKNVLT